LPVELGKLFEIVGIDGVGIDGVAGIVVVVYGVIDGVAGIVVVVYGGVVVL
jgi:hypothetical protein